MSMYLTIFGKPRYLGLVVADEGTSFEKGEQLLVESSRGVEVAVVAGAITERQEALYRAIDNRQEGQPSSDAGLQNVTFLHAVEPGDLEREESNRRDEESALVLARQVLGNHDLDMKLVDVEYLNDRKKLFLYFTSDQRVDFRAYVRDLAREFRTRIELRQIGVRDESKVVKGLGSCGKPCCCSYWLQRFMPIGIRMVKEQNLALNPTKISGLCGRLMCCMSFEQENYRELWSNLPSHGAKVRNEEGTWILLGVDLAARTCSIKGPTGFINIPVTLYQKFKETILAGGTWSNEANGLDEKGLPLAKQGEEAPLPVLDGLAKRCPCCAGQDEGRSLGDDIQSACESLSCTFAEKFLPKGPADGAAKEEGEAEAEKQPHRSRRRRKAVRKDPGEGRPQAPQAGGAPEPRRDPEKKRPWKNSAPEKRGAENPGARGQGSPEAERKAPASRPPKVKKKPQPAGGAEKGEPAEAPEKPNLRSRRRRNGLRGAPAASGETEQKGTE